MPTTSQRVAFSTLVQAVDRLTTAALGALAIIFTTRYLGLDGYGQLTTTVIYLSIFGTISDSDSSVISVREIAKGKRPAGEIVGNMLLLRGTFALAVLGIGVLLGRLLYHGAGQTYVRAALPWLALTLLLASLQNILTAGLSAKLRYSLIAVSNVAGKAATVIFIWASIARGWGFAGIVAAYVFGAVVSFVLAAAFGLWDTRPSFKLDTRYLRYIVTGSLALAVAALLNTLYYRADGVLLSLMRGSSDVGLYGVAYKIVELTMAFALMFQKSILPVFSAAHDNPKRLEHLHVQALHQSNLFAAPLTIGVIILSPQLVQLFGGQAFSAAAAPLAILMVGNFFIYSGIVYGATILAQNRQQIFLRTTSLSLLLNVALNLILIPLLGVVGAAVSVAVTEAAVLLLLRHYHRAASGEDVGYLSLIWRYLAAAAVMGAVVWVLERSVLEHLPLLVNLGLASLIGAGVYGAFTLWFGLVRPAQLRSLLKLS